MPERTKGGLDGRDLRIAIVVSRWNADITDALLAGAERVLAACSVPQENVTIIEVPGAVEIPVAARAVADTVDAVVALACVIKGDTAHFEHVSRIAMDGIARVSDEFAIPVTCGILTTYDLEQALARAGSDDENKGSEATLAAIEMANLLRTLENIQ
jgi:6,7-dimethyl-8-ribityllumazine synthase